MPKIELKAAQLELEKGKLWPLYWLYGPEKLKIREFLKRIRKAAYGEDGALSNWAETSLEGDEVHASEVVDSVLSPSLVKGMRVVIVKEAHALKNSELLEALLGLPQENSDLHAICICIAKDWDGRKKFAKILLEKAAVIPCEEVPEDQKASWIRYLAHRLGLLNSSVSLAEEFPKSLPASFIEKLCAQDPWSLDLMEQELKKISLSSLSLEVLSEANGATGKSTLFLNHFFQREMKGALFCVRFFADSPEETLPLLGLLGWNLRQLLMLVADRENGTHYAKLNPYRGDLLRKWSMLWKVNELIDLQKDLCRIDFSSKQKALLPLGLWTELVTRYCYSQD